MRRNIHVLFAKIKGRRYAMRKEIEKARSLPLKDVSFFLPPDYPAELKATILGAGHERKRAGDDYDWHGNKRGPTELFIWQYTLAGRGMLSYGGRNYNLLPGDAMLLNAPEDHRYWLPRNSGEWEFIYLTLGGSELARLGLVARQRLGVVVQHPADSPAVQSATNIISAGLKHRLKSRYELSRRAYSFMMDLLSETAGNMRGQNEIAAQKARAYCLDHISERIKVEDLAEAANLSRWHFSRAFREAAGTSPGRYILEAKMLFASHLLLNPATTVKEVAAMCGYHDTSYFCKSFKLVHGVTPGEFCVPRFPGKKPLKPRT